MKLNRDGYLEIDFFTSDDGTRYKREADSDDHQDWFCGDDDGWLHVSSDRGLHEQLEGAYYESIRREALAERDE